MQDSNQPDQEETKRQQFIASKEAEIQKITSDYEHHLAKQIIKNNYLNLIK